MHGTVKEGDLLTIAAPGGRFTFTGAEANRIVLLAAGVGITPLMSILRYLTDRKWNGRIDMVYACRTPEDIIFREELESFERRISKSSSHADPVARRGHQLDGATGRIDAEASDESSSGPRRCSFLHVRTDGNAYGDPRSPAAVGSRRA